MIKILDNNLSRLGVIKRISTASRSEQINGENTLDFKAVLDDKLNDLITEYTTYEIDDDYFDTAYLRKDANIDGTFIIEVEAEHVSYRLNDPGFDVEYFTETGTPSYILGKILEDTGFTVGNVELTDEVTYSAQEPKSRRQLLMEFISYIGGEAQFSKFEVGIVRHRGNYVPKFVVKGKNVRVLSKVINKREKDKDGNFLVTYVCEPILRPQDDYLLGDRIALSQKDLGVQEYLRLVTLTYNPYNKSETTFELSNGVNGVENSVYRIETSAVAKDKFYNGCRIGPEFGFEAVRNDKMARAYFRSDTMAFQSGDGTGDNWHDRLYYDYNDETDETTLVFDGKLTANVIEAISAAIDVTISNTVIVNNLYSEYGRIANLTVNELNTAWKKITNYLAGSTAPVAYKRDYEQYSKYIVATTDGTETQQETDKEGHNLFWTDSTHTGMTINTTDPEGNSLEPVMTYVYTDLVKGVISFYDDGSDMIMDIELGAGVGNPLYPDRGKAHIRKKTDGLYILYTTPDGEETEIKLDTFVDAKMRRTKDVNINTASGTISVLMEGETVPETISYTETATSMTLTHSDGFIQTINIV
jgi:hypothetical protein